MFLKPLNLDSDIITPESPNYTLASWIPLDETPVTCDDKGNIVSIFADNVWDFTYYCKNTAKFNFRNKDYHTGCIIDIDNMRLFKLIIAYWLWGVSTVITARTLLNRCNLLKPLFYVCSANNILISDLSKHEEIFGQIAKRYKRNELLNLLKRLAPCYEDLGFKILDKAALKKFSTYFSKEVSHTQTPYIPPRIWVYQVTRLELCINDFLKNKDKVCTLFNHFLDIYHEVNIVTKQKIMREMLAEYELKELLNKWLVNRLNYSSANFSSYLSLVSSACVAYITNFSLMRVLEVHSLKYGCFTKEIVDGKEICLINGSTSKTIRDKNACWIVPPSVEKAVKALEAICELRFNCAKLKFGITQDISEFKPYLAIHTFEPWVARNNGSDRLNLVKTPRKYFEQVELWEKYFDNEQLKITEEDLRIAREMTDNLDEDLFKVGAIWKLGWHQLRRTGAVNMLASGIVSDKSLQFQLKHSNSIMSMYYANNFHKFKFNLNESIGVLYFQERHQDNVRKNEALDEKRFISPHGKKRKEQIILPITEKDHKTLLKMSEKGNLNYRETFLGGCTKKGEPCPYGGITNIITCMGGDGSQPCEAVLLDTDKLSLMYKQEQLYLNKIQKLTDNSIDTTFQEQQLNSIRKALHVIKSNQ